MIRQLDALAKILTNATNDAQRAALLDQAEMILRSSGSQCLRRATVVMCAVATTDARRRLRRHKYRPVGWSPVAKAARRAW